jgi:hypothetical protein
MAAMMRSLSSCLEVTRMWRRTERVSLEKKPSTRLSQETRPLLRRWSLAPCPVVAGHREPPLDQTSAPAQRSAAPSDDAPPKRDLPRRKMGRPGTPAKSAPARPGSPVPFATALSKATSPNPQLPIDNSIACRHAALTFHLPPRISRQGTKPSWTA